MDEYKPVPYTIELNWKTGNIELNVPGHKEKLVVTKDYAEHFLHIINFYEEEKRKESK